MPKPEKRPWKVLLELTPTAVRLLVSGQRGDIVKAQLPAQPDHCRALMFMLEGLALWCGSPLCVVVSAEHPVDHSFGMGPFGDGWPEDSALVCFQFAGASTPDSLRIAGVGDFRVLRQMQRWCGGS
jgi:hypothetical protein